MSLPALVAGQEIIIQIGSWDGSQGTATMTIGEGGGGPEGGGGGWPTPAHHAA